jgi:hypothetical protein
LLYVLALGLAITSHPGSQLGVKASALIGPGTLTAAEAALFEPVHANAPVSPAKSMMVAMVTMVATNAITPVAPQPGNGC